MMKTFTCDKNRKTQKKKLLLQIGQHYILCSVPKQGPVCYTVACSGEKCREEFWVFPIKNEDKKLHFNSVITHTPVAMKRLRSPLSASLSVKYGHLS